MMVLIYLCIYLQTLKYMKYPKQFYHIQFNKALNLEGYVQPIVYLFKKFNFRGGHG
jgi:hypothetical protein